MSQCPRELVKDQGAQAGRPFQIPDSLCLGWAQKFDP